MKDFELIKIGNIEENPVFQDMMDHNLRPFKIYHAGDYEREQVVINVCHDCDLCDYVLVQVARNEEDLPNYGRCHFLTFDSIDVYEGDTVKVMTCCGKDYVVRDSNGHANHVLYWNLTSPVWKESENEVMIMERGNSITSYLQNVNSKEN